MGIGITSFLEDCRSRGLTKHTINTYRSNVSAYLDFVGDPLKADTPSSGTSLTISGRTWTTP